MSHPFLVLGGIAITVLTTAFGVLQVPGWVDAAHDASTSASLRHIDTWEESAVSSTRRYWPGSQISAEAGNLGPAFNQSGSKLICVSASADGSGYAVVAQSESDQFFARTSRTDTEGKGETVADAIAAAGGMPVGVAIPMDGGCIAGAQLVITPPA